MIRKGTIAATGILLLLFACPVSSQTVTIPLTYLYGHPISIKNKPAKCPGKIYLLKFIITRLIAF